MRKRKSPCSLIVPTNSRQSIQKMSSIVQYDNVASQVWKHTYSKVPPSPPPGFDRITIATKTFPWGSPPPKHPPFNLGGLMPSVHSTALFISEDVGHVLRRISDWEMKHSSNDRYSWS